MKAETIERSSKLDICQGFCIYAVNRLFNLMQKTAFSVRHPVLDWNRCYGTKRAAPLQIKGIEQGATIRSISRVQIDSIHSQFHYALIEHNKHPNRFYVIKYYNDFSREEVLALDNQALEFFSNPFALSGYKPSPTRELTAKPHKPMQEEAPDPRYGTYQSTNR